jgi:hypothetical protein
MKKRKKVTGKNTQSGIVTASNLNAVWLNIDGTRGWAVGNNGEILSYDNRHWQRDEQGSHVTNDDLNSLWMDKDGSKG